MTDTEKAALERRIDELCSGNQRLLEEVMSLETALEGMHIINDRYRADHAKLTELAKWMYQVMDLSCAVHYPHEPAPVSIQTLNRAEKELQALGIEVPE